MYALNTNRELPTCQSTSDDSCIMLPIIVTRALSNQAVQTGGRYHQRKSLICCNRLHSNYAPNFFLCVIYLLTHSFIHSFLLGVSQDHDFQQP